MENWGANELCYVQKQMAELLEENFNCDSRDAISTLSPALEYSYIRLEAEHQRNSPLFSPHGKHGARTERRRSPIGLLHLLSRDLMSEGYV